MQNESCRFKPQRRKISGRLIQNKCPLWIVVTIKFQSSNKKSLRYLTHCSSGLLYRTPTGSRTSTLDAPTLPVTSNMAWQSWDESPRHLSDRRCFISNLKSHARLLVSVPFALGNDGSESLIEILNQRSGCESFTGHHQMSLSVTYKYLWPNQITKSTRIEEDGLCLVVPRDLIRQAWTSSRINPDWCPWNWFLKIQVHPSLRKMNTISFPAFSLSISYMGLIETLTNYEL